MLIGVECIEKKHDNALALNVTNIATFLQKHTFRIFQINPKDFENVFDRIKSLIDIDVLCLTCVDDKGK